MENYFKVVSAIAGGGVGYLFGGVDTLLEVLVFFVCADFVSGLVSAGAKGKLSSKKGFRGIAKKAMIFVIVAIAYQADTIMGDKSMIRDAVIFFYLANELISLLENVVKMDMYVPDALKNLVEIFKGKAGQSEKTEEKGDDENELY